MANPGGRPQSVTDEEIVRALRESDEYVLTTGEVAEMLDVSRRTALRRLTSLADAGRIGRKDASERAAVWWAFESDETTESPTEALLSIAGMLDEAEADEARARSEAWREEFDERLAPEKN